MNDENFGYQSRSRPVAALARTNATVPGDRERYRFVFSPSREAQRPTYDPIAVIGRAVAQSSPCCANLPPLVRTLPVQR